MAEGIASREKLDLIKEQAIAEVREAVQFAEESPWPEDDELWKDLYV
jgi:pyruvate dehydrogenase E1 component alpha subunit